MTSATAIFTSLLILIASVTAFVLDGQRCISYPPCGCSGGYVYCYSKSLTAFPNFKVSNVTGSNIYLLFYDNELTSIPSNAFTNLAVSNSTYIRLLIGSNKISTIESNAFTGITDRIDKIYLSNNSLTHVPSALKSLSNLDYLDLRDNPIISLSSSYDTFHSLSHSLKTLYIDLKGFLTWPNGLNILTSLTHLYIRYLNITSLENSAFNGLENTLQVLSFQYSPLERIPEAICYLRNLQTLTFSYNKNAHVITNSTFFSSCKSKLTSLTNLDLSSNTVRYMPDIFRNFPSLTHLTMNDNKLSYIHLDSVPDNSPVTDLALNNNDFTRIPSVVSKFHNFSTLFMNNNKITSIQGSDLYSLDRLQNLYLQNNPLEYISPNAFKNNLVLYKIDIQYTKLHRLPRSLSSLKFLRHLYVFGTPIECDCDLSFMKALNVSQINFKNGSCQSSLITLKKYLTDDMPACP